MFDNPKKELERLEQQLLAAEMTDEEEYADETFDDLYDEIYDEFGDVDQELQSMLEYTELGGRAAGFDAEEEEYYMDEDRYVAAPRKKGIRGLLVLACLEAIAVIALVLWWLGRLP